MVLLITFCFSLFQAGCYFLCAKLKVSKWVDILLFPVFLFVSIKILPNLFLPVHEPEGNCMFSADSIGTFLFMIFGIPATTLVFALNCYFRYGEKSKS